MLLDCSLGVMILGYEYVDLSFDLPRYHSICSRPIKKGWPAIRFWCDMGPTWLH